VKQAAQSRGAPPGLLDGVEDHIIAWIKLLNWEDTKEGKEQELKLINEYLTKFQCEIRFIVWGLKNKDVALEHKILLRKAKKYLMNRSIDTWLLERVHSLEDWFVERRQYRRLHQRSEG
jgi:hypothetical protein